MRRDTEPTWPVSPDLPKDLFTGTARDYAEFRVPYPQVLLDDLLMRSGAAGSGLLVDLACGTGEVALPLAQNFGAVVAVDQEPDMIEVGRARASSAGVKNITWIRRRGEDVDYPHGSVAMVTIGAAFHRLDRRLIAARAKVWLRPCGSLVVLGSNSLWTGKEEWQAVAIRVLDEFTKPQPGSRRALHQSSATGPLMTHREVLAEAGYDVSEHEFTVPHVWSLDSFWGYLLSTSKRSAILAAGAALQTELRRRLLELDPSGSYKEKMAFYYLLAQKAD